MIRFLKVWRNLEGSILDYMISQLFVENIMPTLHALDYMYDDFIDIVYKLIRKEHAMVLGC